MTKKRDKRHTLMVRVASTPDAAAVALRLMLGMARPLLPSTANLLTRRVWPARRRGALRATWPKALGRRADSEVNILISGVGGDVKKEVRALLLDKGCY